MFGMFKRKPDPAPVPPKITPSSPPPVPVPPKMVSSSPPPLPPPIPKGPRQIHHAFTHENIPMTCILGQNRSKAITALIRNELREVMRQGWRQVAGELGEDPALAEQIDLTTLRNDPYVCGLWEFPPALYPGEAACGLLMVGPLGELASVNWNTVPVRYLIVEKDSGPLTRLLEWSPKGYVLLGPGPRAGDPLTVFMDMVFDRVLGKKRPTAEQAAKRLLILKLIGTYAQVVPLGQQLNAAPDLKSEAKADLHSIFGGLYSAKLKEDNLWDDTSPKERELLAAHVKDLTQQQLLNALWRLEAIQVLMWALGMRPALPPYDVQATGEILKGFPHVSPAEFIASARLRDEQEVDKARELAELWHWRSRTRELKEEGRPCPITDALKKAGLTSYEAMIGMTAKIAAADGDLPASIGADFPACGKAYRDMTADEWNGVRSVTMERHFTLNWLCGYSPGNDWDNTPTDT
jgi:hypothetical protein